MSVQGEEDEDEPKAKTEKGVCYFPKIPPYMNPNNLRKLLSQRFKLDRIYLEAECKLTLPIVTTLGS